MTHDRQTAHGVDLETLERFAEHAAEEPDAVQLGLGASATYEGTAAHSPARIDSYELGGETIARGTREYAITYGGWNEVLDAGGWVGATDLLEPVEAALSALAACVNVGISINAAANGVGVDYLRTARTGGAEQVDSYTASIESAGLELAEVRENHQCEFVSERAANACRKPGMRSSSLCPGKT